MSTHIFTPITPRFGYGKYLDIEIVIDSETKYINASKLCKQNGKKLSEWLRYDSNKQLVEIWSRLNEGGNSHPHYEITLSDLKGISKVDQDQIRGQYFHEDLLIMIAQWVSKEFAFKVIDIIKNYNDRHNRSLLKEKDDKIDELMKKLDAMDKRAIETKETIDDMKDMMTDMRQDIRRMRRHLDNAEVNEQKREGILVYRLEHDDQDTIRIRCGTNQHLSKFIDNATWYKEYSLISNAKRALNYLKDNDYLTKQTDTKYYLPDKEQRVKLLKILRKVNASYK